MRRLAAASLLLAVLTGTQAMAAELQFPVNELISASDGFTRNERPRITFTDDGRAHVVWARGALFAEGTFLVSASLDGTYGSAVQISNELDGVLTGEGAGPSIQSLGNYVAVGWEDRNTENSAAWTALSANMGNEWDDPLRADPQNNDRRAFQCVGLYPDGRMAQTWLKYDGENLSNPRYEWSRQNSKGIYEPPIVATMIAGIVCECCPPYQVILDDGLTVLLAFRRNDDNIRETHVVRSTDGGTTFTELLRVDTSEWFLAGCPGSGPHIVADGDNVLVTFMTAGSGSQHVYTARSTDGGASWEPMIQVDTDPLITGSNYSQVALRGDVAVVVWEGRNPSHQTVIYAALSTDQGQSWGEASVVTNIAGPLVREATVAISPSYEIEVVWRDLRDGAPRLYRSRALFDPSSVSVGAPTAQLQLAPGFPNPAAERVVVPFSLIREGTIRITVHDPTGREITEVANRRFAAGHHQVDWLVRDWSGNRVGAGVYWLRFEELGSGHTASTAVRVIR